MRHRSCAQGCSHTLRVGGQHACPVELETYLEVVRHFIVVADVQRDFAVLLVLDVALLVSIARTEIEAVLVRGTRDADVVVGDEPSLEDFILPVGVSRPVREVVFRVAFIPQLLILTRVCPSFAFLVVMIITPLAPRTPKMASDDGSFSISMDSMSCGFRKLMLSLNSPSTT